MIYALGLLNSETSFLNSGSDIFCFNYAYTSNKHNSEGVESRLTVSKLIFSVFRSL
jgi:hypothetical protein